MRRPTLSLGAASGAAVLALAVFSAPGASAGPSSPAIERHPAATMKADQQRVVDYWTEARMKSAIPRGKAINPAKGKPGSGDTSAAAVQVPAQPQFGKVFFTLGGANYVCSGTATTSSNRDVVTTAGHCLNEGPGAYATNFAFVPAYENGNRPYGTWTAKSLLTTNEWRNSGDFNHDVGFAVMNDNASGQSLTDVTGSYPIAFNKGYNLTFSAYGYPAAKPYDGQLLWKCSGTAGVDTRGTTDHRLPCSMTGGSSGGGWITSDGQLNSVNSFGYRGEKDVMYGPYFGNVEQAVYSAAASS
jgi:V8-like Glu-specific endopeptidase